MKTTIITRYGNYVATFDNCSTITGVRNWLNCGDTDPYEDGVMKTTSKELCKFISVGDIVINTNHIVKVIPYKSFEDKVKDCIIKIKAYFRIKR